MVAYSSLINNLQNVSFYFKQSVEWKLAKATGTAQRNKANDWSRPIDCPYINLL